ncbi:MAG: 3-hydroxybutyryl-CoA dehydrogenase [Saprospiraceae bacterium]|nr:3-hydroxybutyryl-CoA dehydrogenase [Saprospiraceae bacterium]
MNKITVIGAGTMGNGIAHVCAQFGFETKLCDISDSALDKALQTISKNLNRQVEKGILTFEESQAAYNRISKYSSISEAVAEADLVIEAATENEAVKLKIFAEIDNAAPPNCILASNTSSISITKIAATTKRPQQVIGMHFMNPVPVMKLVEIIKGYSTQETVCETIIDLSEKLDKIPIVVEDFPGFIANRILMPLINEAIYSLHEGVAGVSEIDQIMKLGMAHPMGPLQLADFIGLDVCLSILRLLHQGLGLDKYTPCPLLVNMVTAGNLGVNPARILYLYSWKKISWFLHIFLILHTFLIILIFHINCQTKFNA